MNRNNLTGLLAISESAEDVAELLDVNIDLLNEAFTDYDSLTRVEKATIDNAVNTYVNITLDGTSEQARIENYVRELEGSAMFLQKGLENLFSTIIANNQIDYEHIEPFGNMFAVLSGRVQGGLMQNILESNINAAEIVAAYYLDDGDINRKDSEFWSIARDFFDS